MAKKPITKPDEPEVNSVSVRLLCVYSGHPANPGPGDVIEVPAEEAERLIELRAAVAA